MIDTTAIRNRDGEPLDESQRPDWVNNHPVLTDVEELGYGTGLPLAADSYSEYPDKDELMNPGVRSFLVDLFSHGLVEGFHDAASELRGVEEARLRELAELHQIDAEELFEDGELTEVEDDCPDGCIPIGDRDYVSLSHFRKNPWEDSRLLGELLSAGMGFSEIAEYISHYTDDEVSKYEISNAVAACGLQSGSSNIDYLTGNARSR